MTTAADIVGTPTPILTVFSAELTLGLLGVSRYDRGAIWIDPRQRRRKYIETVLHEVFHFLLEHNDEQERELEEEVESLAVAVASRLLFVGHFTEVQLAMRPLEGGRGNGR